MFTVSQKQVVRPYMISPSFEAGTYPADSVMGVTAGLRFHSHYPPSQVPGVIHDVLVLDREQKDTDFDIFILDSDISLGTSGAPMTWSEDNAMATQGIIHAGATYVESGNSLIEYINGVDARFFATVTGGGPDDTATLYFGFVNRTAEITFTNESPIEIWMKISTY